MPKVITPVRPVRRPLFLYMIFKKFFSSSAECGEQLIYTAVFILFPFGRIAPLNGHRECDHLPEIMRLRVNAALE